MVEINLLKLNFNDKEFSHIRDIRETVFTNELGISKQELFDKNDETCDHFLIFDGKEIAGSVRILPIDNMVKLERMRSEEHTSELQSLVNLVCRLLLEKKKQKEVVC